MFSLPDFLRSTPAPLLRTYLAGRGIPLPADLPWGAPPAKIVPGLLSAMDALDDAERALVLHDIDRVGAMAYEAGQSAIFAVTSHAEVLEELENGHARAVWLLLNAPEELENAELARFADERRRGRMWDGFVCDRNLTVRRDEDALSAFHQALTDAFGSRHIEVEFCDRSRQTLEGTTSLVQAAIFREGRAEARKAFVNGQVDRVPDRPVVEAALTYEAGTGVIEVVAAARDTRERLVRLFAEHLLGAPLQGGRVMLRQYRLDHLRRRFAFPTDPEDNIEGVRVNSLRLMPYDAQAERITLECMRGATRSIWDMATERFREQDPLAGTHSITQARFTIRFRPQGGRRGPRTLPVTITMPQGCDLRDQTERERLIGEKYLRRWGFLRDI